MTSPKTLLNAWDMRAKKQLGQNFLSDPSTAEMIVRRGKIGPGDWVVEIGAGLGALTVPLARAAERVYAIETDGRLMDLLKTELLAHQVDNVRIMKEDILKLDFRKLLDATDRRWIVIGNLPYHISSQVLVQLVKYRSAVKRAVLMFQKELAMRIAAPPGGKDYGRISVMVQYCSDIRSIAEIRSDRFFPRPKVDSTVLELSFHHPPRHTARDENAFFHIVKAAFSKRRKTLKNTLSASDLGWDPKTTVHRLEAAGIDPQRRAETLTIEEFVRLCNIGADAL